MSPTSTVGVGFGANLANDGPPDLPTQERTEDVEAWRERMDVRREEARGHRDVIQAGVTAEAAVTVRPRPAPPKVRAPRVDPKTQQRAAVVTAYLAGDSTLVLAARYEVTATTIGNWLKAAGVTLRPSGGQHRRAAQDTTAPTPVPEPTPEPTPEDLGPAVVDDLAPVPVEAEPASVPVVEDLAPVPVVTSGWRYVNAEEAAAIVAAYVAGQTAVEIAAAHHRNPGTIRTAVRKAGVQLRDERSTRSGGRTKVDDPAVVDAVRRLYVDEALTQAQVADRLGMGTHAVQKLMGRAGIESRPDAAGALATPRPPAPRITRYFPSDVAVPARPPEPDVGADLVVERACRVCGCTTDRACDGGCWWVEPDLCSACEIQPGSGTRDAGRWLAEHVWAGADGWVTSSPGDLQMLVAANPGVGLSLDPETLAAALRSDPDSWSRPAGVWDGPARLAEAGAIPADVTAVLDVPVDDVVTALQGVVTATEQLLDAQRAVALMRVQALHRLTSELLAVLDHPTTTGARP